MKIVSFFTSLPRLLHALLVLVVVVLATVATSVGALFIVVVLRRTDASTQYLGRTWARVILWVSGVRVEKEGGGKLDPARSYIFAANHQSQYDIFVLQGYLGHDFRWLAKKELFQVPLWGRAMRAAGYIPVDRSHGREAMKSLVEAASRIAAGTSVVLFPEGTRSPDGRLRDFRAGGMHLAIKSGVAVVPVAIAGTHRILPKGRLLCRPGKVRIRVGEPVEVGGFRPKQKQELARRVHGLVEDLLAAQGESPPGKASAD